MTLDYLLKPYLSRPIEKLDVEIRAILETGLYQMLYMNVPPRAAVDEGVKMARGFGKSSAAGFVNAVLRKAAAASLEQAVFDTEMQRIAVTYSVGEEVAEALMQALPEDYEAFLQASFSRPELCLRVNTGKIQPRQLIEKLQEAGAEARAGQVEGAVYAMLPGGVAKEPLFENGLYHVQGEASQLACAALQAEPGQKVLDVCAAPGGKSATLVQYLGGGGGMTACDVRENRVELIRETFARMGVQNAKVLLNDGSVFTPSLLGQDRILCDVPCSGLGVIRSKPDIRYNKAEGFAALPGLQLKILETSARYLNTGGRLVYSTCTVRPEENQQVVKAFLEKNKEFMLVEPQEAGLAQIQGARVDEKMVTILPHLTGLDGFFIATMRKL